MKSKALLKVLALSVVLVVTSMGCSKGKFKNPFGHAGEVAHDSEHHTLDANRIDESSRFYGQNVTREEERDLLNVTTVYFELNRSDLHDEDMLALYAHAKHLLDHPHKRLRIEGHADQRGSREYNIALGERRAQAVQNLLRMKGVPADQMRVFSYGKERPAVLGEGESIWAQNRRSELAYESR